MKTPTWGKAIGIIMIILGSLGIFYQIYKIVVPKIFEIQQEMMSQMAEGIEIDNEMEREFEKKKIRIRPEKFINTFNDKIALTNGSKKWLPTFGGIGILACIFYIIGGVMLLKAKPLNYKIALSALIGMIIYNLFSYTILLSDGTSFMLIGLLIYSFIGVVLDIALLIIFISSDKSKYGIIPLKEIPKRKK